MNVCIPVQKDEGAQSPISAHFGSAPMFMFVDTDTNQMSVIQNQNEHHEHGMCQPLKALDGHAVDSVVVGGIGRGALGRLRAANIRVYQSTGTTVEQTLAALKDGTLQEVNPATACAGHGHGHGHAHHHGAPNWGFGRPPQGS